MQLLQLKRLAEFQARDLVAPGPINDIQKCQPFTLSAEILDDHRYAAFNLYITGDVRSQEHPRMFPE